MKSTVVKLFSLIGCIINCQPAIEQAALGPGQARYNLYRNLSDSRQRNHIERSQISRGLRFDTNTKCGLVYPINYHCPCNYYLVSALRVIAISPT